jgi:hypothetical protein
MRLPTPREEHHMFGTAPLRRLQHAPRVGSIVSKRLFAENVQAVIDCRERHSRVLVVRRRHDDRVDATIGDELGSRMRPIQALYSAGGDADSVRELSVTATGRCSDFDSKRLAEALTILQGPVEMVCEMGTSEG